MKRIFLCLWFFAAPDVWAQAERVTDINTAHTGAAASLNGRSQTSFPREMLTAGDRLWFTADDGIHGVELWSTDGTEVGTRRETDLCPGRCSSYPRTLTAFGSRLFFVGDDGIHGFEPWITDGTAAGTRLLADIRPGLEDGGGWNAVAAETHILFVGDTREFGSEPWVTDGSADGTHLLLDFTPGPESAHQLQLVSGFGRFSLFSAYHPDHGLELWRTDGDIEGTSVLDLDPGTNGGGPSSQEAFRVVSMGGFLYFAGNAGPTGLELWRTDGTLEGSSLVADLASGNSSSSPQYLTVWNNRLYFFASDAIHGVELWTSDGSVGNAQLVFETEPGSNGGNPQGLLATSAGLFFHRNGDDFPSRVLWYSDGTAAGSRMLSAARLPVDVPPMVAGGAGLIFHGSDEAHGIEPWFSDGTESGTFRLADVAPGSESSFNPTDSARGTRRAHLNGRGYFWAWSPNHDFELWSSNGTASGTTQVKDVNAQASSILVEGLRFNFNTFDWPWSRPPAPAATPDGLAFVATDTALDPAHPVPATTGLELWHVHHGSRQVAQIEDLAPGPAPSFFQSLVSASSAIVCADRENRLFSSSGAGLQSLHLQPDHGALVRLPGAVVGGGYALSLDLASETDLPFFAGHELITDGHRVFASDSLSLGQTDGTLEGTRRVTLNSGYAASSPRGVGAGDVVFFWAAFFDGWEPWVWRSNGAFERLRDIRPGIAPSVLPLQHPNSEWEGLYPRLETTGPTAFFAADDGLHGEELWATDGTTPGTRLVAEIFPGPRGADLRRLTPVGSRVYFVADDGVHGRELWLSDGTAAGTRLVRDLAPGPGSATPQELTAIGGFLVFNAWTPEHGRELWISDGTAIGTRRLTDIAPGPLSSSPVTFVAAGGWLYFTANDNVTGDELWRLPLSLLQLGTIFADGFESGNLSAWSTP
ncbi:MAG: hypothetical protein SF066_19160 [Thermoanaerobaculia bacterium]|nr:hypothetical protein [Thermoanaerobaculia bacterium]